MILGKRPEKKRECTLRTCLMTQRGINVLLSLFFTGLFLFCIAIQFDFYYDLNDDTAMKDILSGAHTGTPSGYNIQMLYPLSFLLSLLYRVFPKASCYGIFLCLCQFGAVFCAGYALIRLVNKNIHKVFVWIATLVLWYSLMLYQMVYVQYSVTSGMLMAAAVLLYVTGFFTKQKERSWPIILLVLLSFCIRTELCLMLMPFWLLCGFYRWWNQENKWKASTIFSIGKIFLVTFLGMIVALGIQQVAYGSQDWKQFMSYFDERTTLYDFIEIPTYDENKDFYESIDMSKAEWTLLQNYNFAIDREIDADKLAQIVAYRQSQAQQESSQPIYQYGGMYTKQTIKEAIWSYKHRLLENIDGTWYYILLATYLCVLMAGSVRRRSAVYLKVFLLFAGRSAIWIYLLMRDRTPERILVPLFLMEWIVLLGLMIQEVRDLQEQKQKLQRFWMIGMGMLLGFAAVAFLMPMQNRVETEDQHRAEVNQEWQAIQQYCKSNPQNYYLLDVYSTVAYSEKMFENVDNTLRNYDLCGGWVAKSPVTAWKLAKYQITDLQKDLVEQNHIFVISKTSRSIDWLEDFYVSQAETITVNAIDSIAVSEMEAYFTIYEVLK